MGLSRNSRSSENNREDFDLLGCFVLSEIVLLYIASL